MLTHRVFALAVVILVSCSDKKSTSTPDPATKVGTEPTPKPTEPPKADAPELAFDIVEGDIHNYFYRRGPVAAHVLASSGTSPRLIVAFPAGNTGIAVWFQPTAAPI